MKTSSCKAKGRRLQKRVAFDLLQLVKNLGLVADDIVSRPMATQGGEGFSDIMLSPAARKVLPFNIECKNVEHLNVAKTFQDYKEVYQNSALTLLLVHSHNKTEPMVTMNWIDFLRLLQCVIFPNFSPSNGAVGTVTHTGGASETSA
jgi:hypothetical protein